MRSIAFSALMFVVLFFGTTAGFGQTDPNPAVNNPDKLAWTLFLTVSADAKAAGNNNALFETWARDADTFQTSPVWPTSPPPLTLRPRVLGLALQSHASGRLTPFAVPGGDDTEETRRNKPAFDFIVQNDLYKVSGLRRAFTADKPLSFPVDALEVKGNWVELGALKGFNGFSGTPADAAKIYHVNSAGGKQYALVALHVISKLVPNWTWATFEHKDNPGRCDVLGCNDAFGAQQPYVKPISDVESQQAYPDCGKSPELRSLFQQTKIDPAFVNYCLKGSQTEFTDTTGLAIRMGNSVTEKGFVAQASCMSCHGRAAFDATGKFTSFAGFDPVSVSSPRALGNAPVGPINPSWYWVPAGPPSFPMLEREGDIAKIAASADFVWSIPFCAIDDTATPPETTSACRKK